MFISRVFWGSWGGGEFKDEEGVVAFDRTCDRSLAQAL